ncbi:hypothetical protein tinsulaeT_04380 [Thalassotalea insulae]|uniref:Tetratricopeptide repeat protein n=1 Tax=Thalassotalea insulae TaxID=2056778 RepID=A0ABQ6GM86_9GAMM|nr:hypothetical protein [Thalassotalea insulae]GLX77098.1 hypothetical protein tinsulaeT_04380 [Thalassotalea insulae]
MKLLNKSLLFIVLSTLINVAVSAKADGLDNNELLDIQHKWAEVNYQLSDKAQLKGFEQLIAQVEISLKQQPDNAENWVWLGIIQSSYAGAKGGLGALSFAKKAKKSLEKALSINDTVLDGSAYTSLGTLYYKVPGWPIGFGDDDKAKELLERALVLNPDGIDPNYFMSEYWFEERKYEKAKMFLERAQQAPTRENRPLADKSRHYEITQLMAKIDRKLKKKHH